MERTVLIALTGFGQERDQERSRAAGFARHLVKPVDPSDLKQLLEELRIARD
jgi:CheY-like chemotaxis protein